jgi:Abnormal spindle-like microcephaly-assoc'd, ASPM-SPD-2-Hydin
MKLLARRGVGRQAARVSQTTDKSNLKFLNNALAALALVAAIAVSCGLSACAGYTSAAAGTVTQDPKSGVLSASSGNMSFGNIAVGSTATLSASLTNTGLAAVNISQATISGTGFTVVGAVPSGSVAVGQSVLVTFQFAPQSSGAASGTFTVTSDASNSPASVSLTGTGMQPSLAPSPVSLTFGSVNVGSNASQNVMLTNSGNESITVSGITPAGAGITVSGLSLPQTINAGANATFAVQFAPAVSGSVSGSISIANNGPVSPTIVAVSGTGAQAEIAATPGSVSFGNVATGDANSQPIQISNGGNAALTISQVTMTGAGNGFSTTGLSAPLTIQAGKSASFDAVFTPGAAGSVSGSISLVSNAPNSPLAINLTGTGTVATRALSASSSSLSFGNVNEGTKASQNVTITNTGNSNVTISSVGATGTGYTVSGVQSGLMLTPNQKATLTVSFDPSSPGAVSGTATVTSNATNSPLSIGLSGTGEAITQHSVGLSWSASTTAGVVGYYVYRGTSAGSYTRISTSAVAATTYSDSSVTSGQDITYYYVVTAVDGSGVESSDSNTATVTVP